MIYNWHKAEIEMEALTENTLTEVQAGEKRVGLLKKGAAVYAFAAMCPHAGAQLCDGWIDAKGHIVCPLHKYRFDPVNGRNTSGEGYKLKTYMVDIQNGSIFIGY
jgi:nitrite reductase/ring-hydroxylating ferredoxin subunit